MPVPIRLHRRRAVLAGSVGSQSGHTVPLELSVRVGAASDHARSQCGPASTGTGASARIGSGLHASRVGCATGWFSQRIQGESCAARRLMQAADLPEGPPVRGMLGTPRRAHPDRPGRACRRRSMQSHIRFPGRKGPRDLPRRPGGAKPVAPRHGSVFRVCDGAVVRGPATAPQPVFDTRVVAGAAPGGCQVQARALANSHKRANSQTGNAAGRR